MDIKAYTTLLNSQVFQELLAGALLDLKKHADTYDTAKTVESAARAYDRRGGGERVLNFLTSQATSDAATRVSLDTLDPTFGSEEIYRKVLDPRKD